MLIIENAGQALKATNYWDSEHAQHGFFYLSWNAGAARLLVPDAQTAALQEMQGAREVIVSRGPWTAAGGQEALELLWEDHTDSPFAIHLLTNQTDRLIPAAQQGGGFVVAAWAREGPQGRWPGRYRIVPSLPCLAGWGAH